MSLFRKATKHASRLRLAFVGPAGSGKTYSALAVATNLGSKVAVIDTERGSASKYADVFEFDVLEPTSFAPEVYAAALSEAEKQGYDVVVIDSLSHAWMGKDGALEQVDQHARKAGGGNSFAAWRFVTPQHNAMVDAIIGSKSHVIVTMRAKTEWVLEKDPKSGKQVPRKVGMAPVQRDGLEYEFDVVGDLDADNALTVTKTRCPALTGKLVDRPGKEFADTLRAWLEGAPPPAAATPEEVEEWQLKVKLAASVSVDALKELVTGEMSTLREPLKEVLRPIVAQAQKDARKLAAERIKNGQSPDGSVSAGGAS